MGLKIFQHDQNNNYNAFFKYTIKTSLVQLEHLTKKQKFRSNTFLKLFYLPEDRHEVLLLFI